MTKEEIIRYIDEAEFTPDELRPFLDVSYLRAVSEKELTETIRFMWRRAVHKDFTFTIEELKTLYDHLLYMMDAYYVTDIEEKRKKKAVKLLMYTVYVIGRKDEKTCVVRLRAVEDYPRVIDLYRKKAGFKNMFYLPFFNEHSGKTKKTRHVIGPDRRFSYGTILMTDPETGEICGSFQDRAELMAEKNISKANLSKYLKSSFNNPADMSRWIRWKDNATGSKYCFVMEGQYERTRTVPV